MVLYGIIAVLIIIVIILTIKLGKKIHLDNSQIEELKQNANAIAGEVNKLRYQKDDEDR